MDERQAIEFILQEIKEQSRKDFELYFQLRTQRNEEYKMYLDRLRDIDEREDKTIPVKKPEFKPLEVRRGKLPEPRFKGTPEELRVDRIDEEIPEVELSPIIPEYRGGNPTIPYIPREIKPTEPKIPTRKVHKVWTEWEKEHIIEDMNRLRAQGYSYRKAAEKMAPNYQFRNPDAIIVRYKEIEKLMDEQE